MLCIFCELQDFLTVTLSQNVIILSRNEWREGLKMETDKINMARVEQNLLKIPKSRLGKINDFIESILSKTESSRLKRAEKLKGIWQGLGFERISDLDKSIREIRNESEKAMLDRMAKCNT